MTEIKRRRRRAAPAGIVPDEPERDILDQYLYEVSTCPLLKGMEEIVLARIIKASEILRQKLSREPNPEELSHVTGLSVDVVQSLAALNTSEVRLDAPLDPEGDRSLIERFVVSEMPDTEEEAMHGFLANEIGRALGTLPPRDAKVLRFYFGLGGGR